MKISKSKLRKIVREEIKNVTERRVEFDVDKMRRLVDDDMFLKHSFKTSPGRDEEHKLEVMFNSFVLGDSAMERAYERA